MGKNQHVVPHHGGWAVRGEYNAGVTSQHDTQGDAIDAGHAIAGHQQSEPVIHGRDRRIRDQDSHGRDPYPPAG
jgi:hypothetical protein